MQRNQARPVGTRFQNRPIPDFRLRTGVGEDERRAAALNLRDHLRQQAQAEMAGPRKPLDARRQQRVNLHLLRLFALHQLSAPLGQQYFQGV